MSSGIDPEIIAVRAKQAAKVHPFDITALPACDGRLLINESALGLNDGAPAIGGIDTFEIAGGDGQPMRARLYRPDDPAPDRTILYVHGGGWFACDVDTHDRMLRMLARESRVSVLGIDYRLSPENIFPAALDDVRAAWIWLKTAAADRGIASDRIAVAGDSAGANLALALALDRRDAGAPGPRSLALIYGCFAPGLRTNSMTRFSGGAFGLTAERMAWYWKNYLGSHAKAPPSLAAPLHADLGGLPPVYLGVAECDVVADDSRLLAERLQRAGVAVTISVWPGTTHGVLQMTRDVAAARRAVAEIAATLASSLE